MFGRSKRPVYTAGDVEAHLSQITIDSGSSNNENLEALTPIIKGLQDSQSEQAYLRTLNKFVGDKEKEIEEICGDNYEDFISSVSTLLTVRQGTVHLRRRIGELDGQMGDVGRALGEKKRALLQQKKVASNIDEAIETLQTCLRVLDGVNRIGEMIKEGKYFAALRSLEELRQSPPSQISQTPFYNHIVSSLPSLRSEIKTRVTESEKSWLFDIRNNGALIGRVAMEQMEARTRKWRGKGKGKVGGPLELGNNERAEFDPLNNDKIKVDFKPLFQCIHMYDSLNCRSELQRNYHQDRKTQAALLLSQRSATTPSTILTNLPALMEELVGFFIVESYVLRATRDFRSPREVEDLWDEMGRTVVDIVGEALKNCEEPEVFLQVKGMIVGFIQTLEGYGYDVKPLTKLLMTLFEKYSNLLQRKFSAEFDQLIMEDDNQPMMVNDQTEFDQVVGVCWLATGEAEQIAMNGFPTALPVSQTFPMACISIRSFVDAYYGFAEGMDQHHRDIDDLLRKSLDGLLISHVSKNICLKLNAMTNLSQIAQMVLNIEHFKVATEELETVLMTLSGGSSRTGGVIALQSGGSFASTLDYAQGRIDSIISSKLASFFEMAEMDWEPGPIRGSVRQSLQPAGNGKSALEPDREPSTYLFEAITFLGAYVDSVLINLSEEVKVKTYTRALEFLAKQLMGFLVGPESAPKYNDKALSHLLGDVRFIEREIKQLNKPDLDVEAIFAEIKMSIGIILSDAVNAYLDPTIRATSYKAVRPQNLKTMLVKMSLAKVSGKPGNQMTTSDVERMNRRKREAESVNRLLTS